MAITSSGCGTVLHSERIGQSHGNDIDWKVAALDGLGLMLFFVPGVVAFAVDFYTGSIYLPRQSSRSVAQGNPGEQLPTQNAGTLSSHDAKTDNSGDSAEPFDRTTCLDEQLTEEQVEAVVSQHVGQTISLVPSRTRVSKLTSLDRFTQQCETHRRDSRFGVPLREFFARKNRSFKNNSDPKKTTWS